MSPAKTSTGLSTGVVETVENFPLLIEDVEALERVFQQLTHESPPDTSLPGTCWIWTGHTNRKGYGIVQVFHIHYLVHRLVYKLLMGINPPPFPDFHLHHRCYRPPCVNPLHLEILTPLAHVHRHRAGVAQC